MAAIHGKNAAVYMGTSGVAIKIINARSWKINVDRAFDDDNKLGDEWVTQLEGFKKWSGTIDGNLDTADTTPFDAVNQLTLVNAYFYPQLSQTSRYYYGTIWPKIDITISLDATERWSGDFDGDGILAYN